MYPESFAVKIVYDQRLGPSHRGRIGHVSHASRYEPCGLNQLYSLKYGTVPSSGGGRLDDTIEDDPETLNRERASSSRLHGRRYARCH